MGVKSHLINLWNDALSEDLSSLLTSFEEILNVSGGNPNLAIFKVECSETGIKSRVEILSSLFDGLCKTNPSTTPPPTDEAQVPITPSADVTRVDEGSSEAPRITSECHSTWVVKLAAFSYG